VRLLRAFTSEVDCLGVTADGAPAAEGEQEEGSGSQASKKAKVGVREE
jgi:hypothetical protein